MSLYQKHRPPTFEGVFGNEDIITTLEKLTSNPKKCPHAFLLIGETGCGKTTIARIIADRLGCIGSDLREIDNATFRGIDSVREVKGNAQFAPMQGPCKVYIFDEIHKMMGDAQNALLKELEEIRPNVYYILCTTDPQKLLPTVKGRCSIFQVKTLPDSDMKSLLKGIIKAEKVKIEDEILDQIILDSLGHPRNAINILEQVIACPPERRLKVAKQSAELQTQGIELCRLLLKGGPWKPVAVVLSGLKDQEPESIRRIVMGYCSAILLKSDNERCGMILECFMEPNFTNGFPQLVFSCYQSIKG